MESRGTHGSHLGGKSTRARLKSLFHRTHLQLTHSYSAFQKCNMIRIYTKPKGQIPDYDEPVILHSERNPTIEQFCNRLHRNLINEFSHAFVW